MRFDDSVKKRFEELDSKASEVAATESKGERGTYVNEFSAKAWETSVLNLIQRIFGEDSVHYRSLTSICEKSSTLHGNQRKFLLAKAIFDAAREDYLGGYLFNLSEIIHADIFSDYLEAANYLNNEGYKDAAAVITGSTMEQHLRALCKKNNVLIDVNGKPKKADLINSELCSAGAYAKGDQKNVTAWLNLRNDAAHGNYNGYTKEQVALLIQSVRDFITRNPA